MKYRQISSLFFSRIYFLTDAVDFYLIIQDLQKDKKLIHFPPTKLSEKEMCVNLEILVLLH